MNSGNSKKIIKWLLIIAVIIVVIVLITQYIMGIIKKEKTKELQADLLLVQAKVEIVKGKNNMNKDENPLKGMQLSKIVEKFKLKDKVKLNNISAEEMDKFYLLRDSDLSTMELQELVGKNRGYYIVNYDNYEVIYTIGYENTNGLWCYKISDLNKQPEIPDTVPVFSNNVEENKTEEENQEASQESSQEASQKENKEESTNTEQQQSESEANQDNQANQVEEEKTEESNQINAEEAAEKRNYFINRYKNLLKLGK